MGREEGLGMEGSIVCLGIGIDKRSSHKILGKIDVERREVCKRR